MGTGAKIAIGIGVAFGGLILIGVIGAALGAGDEETPGATPTTEAPQNDPTDTETKASESPTESSPEASPSPTEESDPVALSGSGVYLVPQEIKPGTYTAPDAKGCYWERLKGLGGGFNAIIANGNAAGPIVVTIGAQDKAFNSGGCGDWYKGTPVITDDPTKISDGIWSVPENVKPGTYRTQAKGCYWARLSNFSGGFSGIIANNNVNGQALVKISASDAGFESTRCGTWERVG